MIKIYNVHTFDLFVVLQFRDGVIRFYPPMTPWYEDIALKSEYDQEIPQSYTADQLTAP